jgi:hypothetical protein
MIAFRISSPYGDYYLDVPTDITVTLTVNSAFFDVESIQRAFTYDFVLPRTPRTDAQLQHLYRLDSSRETGEFATEMLILGQPHEKGILVVQSVESGYQIVFQNKNRAILDSLDAALSTFFTIPFSLLPTGYDARWKYRIGLYNFQSNTGNYVTILINGQSFSETVQGSISNPSNWGATLPRIAAKIQIAFPSLEITSDVSKIDILSENQLQFGEYQITNHTQVAVLNSHTPQATAQFVTQQIQTLSEDPTSPVVFPSFTAPNFYSDDKPPHYYMRIVNECDEFTGQFFINEATTEKQAFKNCFVPMLRLTYVLSTICTKLSLTLGGEWINLSSTNRLIFANTVTIDDIVELTTTPPQYVNQCKTSFLPAEHLPDMTAKELLKEICEDFGLAMHIEGSKLILTKKALKSTLQHWTNKLVADKLKVEPGLNQGVKISYNWGDTSKFQKIPTNYGPLSIGKIGISAKAIQLNFNTLLKYYERDHVGLPKDTVWYWGKAGDRPKTFLLYYGRNTSFGNYPYASSDNIDYQGNELNDYNLSLSDAKGRYQTHLKGIVELQNARTATAIFRLTLEDLQNFQRGDYGKIIAYTPQGELRAAIKDITLKIRNNTIEPATINLLRL